MPLSKEQMLQLLQNSIRNKTGGDNPTDVPSNPGNRVMPPADPNQIQVGPAKPDPEAVANARINAAASRPADPNQANMQDLQQLNQQLNGILGTSGGVPQSQEQVSPEQRARLDQQRDKLEMMKKFYQNKANGQ